MRLLGRGRAQERSNHLRLRFYPLTRTAFGCFSNSPCGDWFTQAFDAGSCESLREMLDVRYGDINWGDDTTLVAIGMQSDA